MLSFPSPVNPVTQLESRSRHSSITFSSPHVGLAGTWAQILAFLPISCETLSRTLVWRPGVAAGAAVREGRATGHAAGGGESAAWRGTGSRRAGGGSCSRFWALRSGSGLPSQAASKLASWRLPCVAVGARVADLRGPASSPGGALRGRAVQTAYSGAWLSRRDRSSGC